MVEHQKGGKPGTDSKGINRLGAKVGKASIKTFHFSISLVKEVKAFFPPKHRISSHVKYLYLEGVLDACLLMACMNVSPDSYVGACN